MKKLIFMKVSNTLRFDAARNFALQQTDWFDKPLIITSATNPPLFTSVESLSGERYTPIIIINNKSKDQRRYIMGRVVSESYRKYWMSNFEPIRARNGDGPFVEIDKGDMIGYE